MIVETIDKRTGTILFTKDQDSLDIELLMNKVRELEARIQKLESKIEKEDS